MKNKEEGGREEGTHEEEIQISWFDVGCTGFVVDVNISQPKLQFALISILLQPPGQIEIEM